jgi:hypothetical protein
LHYIKKCNTENPINVINLNRPHTAQPGLNEFRPTVRYIFESEIFSSGSITKTFTATMILQLYEEGIIDLSSPLGFITNPFKISEEDII